MEADDERRVIRMFIWRVRAARARAKRDPAVARQIVEDAYRALAAEEAAETEPPRDPVEAALRRARRAVLKAYEKGRHLALVPMAWAADLRTRASRARCQAGSATAACVGASAEAVVNLLAALVIASTVASALLPSAASGSAALRDAGRHVALPVSLASQSLQSFQGGGTPRQPLDDRAELSLHLGTEPGSVPGKAAATIDRGDRGIAIEREVTASVGDREVQIIEHRTWIACNAESVVLTTTCDAYDHAAEAGSGR